MTALQHPGRFFGLLFIAVTFFSLAGGPLALLQTVAWVNMIHDYAAQGSFTAAVEKTFDGRHPCSLCKKIAAEKKKENKTALYQGDQSIKATLLLSIVSTTPPFPKRGNYFLKALSKNNDFSCEPLTPPPRS